MDDVKQNQEQEEIISLLDDAITNAVNNPDSVEQIEQTIFSQMDSDPDIAANLYYKYNSDKKNIESEKQQYEEAQNALKEISRRIKEVDNKKGFLKQLIASYLETNSLEKSFGENYVWKAEKGREFVLSDDFVEELLSKLNLPDWIEVTFSVKKEALEENDIIPVGIDVIETTKCKVVKALSRAELQILEMFNRGNSIKTISDILSIQWRDVYNTLFKAISKGYLDIHDLTTQDSLDEIMNFSITHPQISNLGEFADEFRGQVSYDVVALALKYLKIKH